MRNGKKRKAAEGGRGEERRRMRRDKYRAFGEERLQRRRGGREKEGNAYGCDVCRERKRENARACFCIAAVQRF